MRRTALRVGKNLTVLIGSHVVNRLAHLFLLGTVGRLLGAEALGGYAVSLALAAVFLFATDLGLSPWLTREIASQPEQRDSFYARALGVKVVAGGLALACFLLLRLVLPYPPWVLELSGLLVLAAVIESFSQMNNAVCRARERMELEAVAASIQTVVVVGGSIWLLGAGRPPVALGYAAIAGSLAEAVVTFFIVRRFVGVHLQLPRDVSALRAAGPYAITSLNALAFFQLDVILLSLLLSQAEVGRYAAVSRLLQGAGYLALLAGTAVLPTLTVAWSNGGRELFRRMESQVIRGGVAVAGATVILLLASARQVMVAVYGPEFAPLSGLLRLGGAYLFLKIVAEALSPVLTAAGRQPIGAASRVAGTVCVWLLLILLAPALATRGAIVALIAGEAVVCAIQAVCLRGLVRDPVLASSSR